METGRRPATSTAVVIEDDLILCATISGALEDSGFVVIQCSTLVAGRAAIKTYVPAVIILDLSLEGEFGGDLIEELSQETHAPTVVICSAFSLAPMVAARYGVPCVRKPFELEALLSEVHKAITAQSRPARSA